MRAQMGAVRVVGALVAAVLGLGVVGCGATPEPDPVPAGTGAGASADASAPAGTPATVANPLACAQLRDAEIENGTVKIGDYPFDSIRLADGRWAIEDGTTILLQDVCAIGDLTGDGAADALGVVVIDSGGTGKFVVLVAWRNEDGRPVLAATEGLGDRTPVVSISVAGGEATVVYRTRADDEPMAVLTVTRTATYRLSAGALTEGGHTDAPYAR